MGRFVKLGKIIFLILIVIMIVMFQNCKGNKNNTQPEIAVKDEMRSIDIFGRITTSSITNVNIDFPAKVEKIHVKEGQKVKLGDPLVTLSIKDFESQIKSKEIDLENAKFELKSDLLELDKYREKIKPAESDLEKAASDFENKKTMFKDGLVAKKDVDDAESLMNAKKQAVNEIKIALEKLESKDSAVEIKRVMIQNIQNQLEYLKDKINVSNFRKNTIISEIKNGIVFEIEYSNGDIIIPSQNYKKILGIMDLDTMIVQADVPEEFVKDMRIGSKVIISPSADTERKYEGKISRISSMAIKKNNETIISIDITFDKIDDFLRPNYNVDVKVLLGVEENKNLTNNINK